MIFTNLSWDMGYWTLCDTGVFCQYGEGPVAHTGGWFPPDWLDRSHPVGPPWMHPRSTWWLSYNVFDD